MSEWISVEDGLPESSCDYLCVLEDSREDYQGLDEEWVEVVYFKWFECKDFKSHWVVINFNMVTYWMPVPELPAIYGA